MPSDRCETRRPPARSRPLQDYLAELHQRISSVTGGKPADYIPELGKADPNLFGIAIATVDGQVYAVGDTEIPFTIQSVSKPFMYGYALQHHGREAVLKHVGVEPTGEAFNSIVLDEVANRPFNPMVNAGAIAVAELMRGANQAERIANMLALFSSLAGRELEIDEAVFQLGAGHRPPQPRHRLHDAQLRHDQARSERGARPLFPAMLGQRHGRDLAIMAATLANDGANPLTGAAVLRDPICPRHAVGDEFLRHVRLCRRMGL